MVSYCRRTGVDVLIGTFPADALAAAVAREVQHAFLLAAIEIINGRAQAVFGIVAWHRRERIVDPGGPTFFFEGRKDRFLTTRPPAESP